MINFIIEDINLKETIEKIMMNYNLEYKINKYNDKKKKELNSIYILNYDTTNKAEINKLLNIRINEDDWSSIIILISDNSNIKYRLVDNKLLILDVIDKNKDIYNQLIENIKISLKILTETSNSICYTYKGILYNIPQKDIVYIESDSKNKRSVIKTETNEYYIPLTLPKIEKILNENFVKCSRSYIININKMREYNTKDNIITLNGDLKIYEISRQKKKEIINLIRKTKLLNLSNFVVKEQKQ